MNVNNFNNMSNKEIDQETLEDDFCKDFKNCHKCGFKDNSNCERIDEINEKEFRLSIIISLLLVIGMLIYYVMKGFK